MCVISSVSIKTPLQRGGKWYFHSFLLDIMHWGVRMGLIKQTPLLLKLKCMCQYRVSERSQALGGITQLYRLLSAGLWSCLWIKGTHWSKEQNPVKKYVSLVWPLSYGLPRVSRGAPEGLLEAQFHFVFSPEVWMCPDIWMKTFITHYHKLSIWQLFTVLYHLIEF